MSAPSAFDPRAVLQALESARVNYVLIGALARVLHGTDETTDRVAICPQRRTENVERLRGALATLGVDRSATEDLLASTEPALLKTRHGILEVASLPAGTRRGWADLRGSANREALGGGLRVSVASLDDLTRLHAAQARDDAEALDTARRLRRLADLERSRGRGLSR
jgi:hypothetical protein